MTIPFAVADRPAVAQGRPSWRVTVASEADRLEVQLMTALGAAAAAATADGTEVDGTEVDGAGWDGVVAAGPVAARTAHSAIQLARDVAARRAGPRELLTGAGLRDWWHGTSIESAWQPLHLASEQLCMVQPVADLRAQVPHLANLAHALFSPTRARDEVNQLDTWVSGHGAAPDPRVAWRILTAHHARSDAQHQQIRSLRNLAYLMLAVVAGLDCALWASGLAAWPTVGLGALAGALSVVLALKAGTPPGPYNVLLPQSLLKVACGAATAVLAVKILDYIGGTPVAASRDAMYAIVFGFSQQAFTRLVDQQAGALARGPTARPGPVRSPCWRSAAADAAQPSGTLRGE